MKSTVPTILVTQRVAVDPVTGERRDALDQRWPLFLQAAGMLPIAVPNGPGFSAHFFEKLRPDGILLTGGNDLANFGGDAPDRDEMEESLIAFARTRRLPLMGVCRGMQMIQKSFGVTLHRVEGHVMPHQIIEFDDRPVAVNSYHRFGTYETAEALSVCGRAKDGVIKAVRAKNEPILGIMWHPERIAPPRAEDIALFRDFFGQQP